jgi:hypothetical protein
VVEEDINAIPMEPAQLVQLMAFLETWVIQKGAGSISQIQVRWSDHPETLHTWEEATDLRRHFPQCSAWGQAEFQGKGNVRTRRLQGRKRPDKRQSVVASPAIEKKATRRKLSL